MKSETYQNKSSISLIFELPIAFVLSVFALFIYLYILIFKHWDSSVEYIGKDNALIKIPIFFKKELLNKLVFLSPYILIRKIDLVGGLYEKDKGSNISERCPGIINLIVIQNITRMIGQGTTQLDEDYLKKSGYKEDLRVFLSFLFTILFSFGGFSEKKVINILDINFLNIDMKEAMSLLREKLTLNDTTRFFFINAHCLNISAKDKEYKKILQSDAIIFPDGIGINIGSRMIGTLLKENINGTDMYPEICKLCVENNKSIYFLGGRNDVPKILAEKTLENFPKLNVPDTITDILV